MDKIDIVVNLGTAGAVIATAVCARFVKKSANQQCAMKAAYDSVGMTDPAFDTLANRLLRKI
jgi:hypothetical protein